MNPIADEILMHYGVAKRSGRYPWGSGGDPYQHSGDFLSRVEELEKTGLRGVALAKALDMTTTQFRVYKQVASHERRALAADRARSLISDGKSPTEIAKIMGYKSESSIRSLLDENTAERANKARATVDILKKELEKKSMIDLGVGVERELGISETKLKEAVTILQGEGYNVYPLGIPNVTTPGKQINTKILCGPEITYKHAYENMGDFQSFGDYHSTDGGSSYTKLEQPSSLSSSRIKIQYGDEGGANKDGVIELRRGVNDLDLGNSHYAQVRIMVDGTHYLKGMAMYSDTIPDGVDIVFNTNKKTGVDKMDVLKKIKDDPDNPFGATIKANGQSTYKDKDGTEKLSPINKLKEEGDWDVMSRNLSSQFLSKQPVQLIKKQLNLTYKDKEAEYDEIMSLTNPTLKKKMLKDFADECDSATVHLKAAALPGQKTQVILPINSLKETEVYAPNYDNGTKVVLIRFPHGGLFEIPELVVNNKNKSAISILGNVKDAVGINSKVAEKMSGADFDGDQAVVIPINDRVRVKTLPTLKELKDFDPKTQYSTEGKPGIRLMTKEGTQKQMGMVSNLITDMTLHGAPPSDIARAVKHSMVVIDAEKHKLDYRQSEKDNGIAALKKKYQVRTDDDGEIKEGGASTLLSRRKQDVSVLERQGSGIIDTETGKVTYGLSGRDYEETKKVLNKTTGEITKVKTGNILPATEKAKLINETDDLRTLSSGTVQENAYADYGNKLKALANRARKEVTVTGNLKYSATAKITYQKEVDSLNAKLNTAAKNAPRERRAMAIANATVKAKVQDNPDMDKKDLKKAKQLAINNARVSVSASGKETKITLTDREWDAIQSGAITDSKLSQILRYADPDNVKQRATPRTTTQLSTAKINKIKAYIRSGYTNAEIASSMGISASTINKYVND